MLHLSIHPFTVFPIAHFIYSHLTTFINLFIQNSLSDRQWQSYIKSYWKSRSTPCWYTYHWSQSRKSNSWKTAKTVPDIINGKGESCILLWKTTTRYHHRNPKLSNVVTTGSPNYKHVSNTGSPISAVLTCLCVLCLNIVIMHPWSVKPFYFLRVLYTWTVCASFWWVSYNTMSALPQETHQGWLVYDIFLILAI